MNDDDLINKTRPISKYKKMSIENRAAQFQPFQALVGHEENIKELERYVEEKKDLEEWKINELEEKINRLKKNLKMKPYVTITYFQEDLKKEGGYYQKTSGFLKKIDEYEKQIEFINGKKVRFENVIDLIERKNENDERI